MTERSLTLNEKKNIFQRDCLPERACIMFKRSQRANAVTIFRARQFVMVIECTVLNQAGLGLSLGSTTCYIDNLGHATL